MKTLKEMNDLAENVEKLTISETEISNSENEEISNSETLEPTSDSEKEYLDLWNAADTVDRLFVLNTLFLAGIIGGTPYHRGPLCRDSIPLARDLVELHLGNRFFSVNGQGSCVGKTWSQRPFLEGFMIPEFTEKLVARIKEFNTEQRISKKLMAKDCENPGIEVLENQVAGHFPYDNLQEEKEYYLDDKILYSILYKKGRRTNIGQELLDKDVFNFSKRRENGETTFVTNLDFCLSFEDMLQENFHGFSDDFAMNVFDEHHFVTLSTQQYGSRISLEKFLLSVFNS